jgi:hypothetical protein
MVHTADSVNMSAHNLISLVRWFRFRNDLEIENLTLRQKLGTLKLKRPRPTLTDADRAFWVRRVSQKADYFLGKRIQSKTG